MTSDINLRVQGKAGRITLQRPQALNAMTYEMCLAIEKTLIEWKCDPKIELIIIDAKVIEHFVLEVIFQIYTKKVVKEIMHMVKNFGTTNIGLML